MKRIEKRIYTMALLVIALLVGFQSHSHAQCGKPLVEQAVAEAGNDAMYMRHFEVSFSKASLRRPEKVAKFNTLLSEGNSYRFNVKDSDTHPGEAILQLRYKGSIVAATVNEQGKNQQRFDYQCITPGYYQVLISFLNGEPGCAVGVQSTILSSQRLSEKNDTADLTPEELEVLYTGVENPLNIAATGIPEGSMEVSIDEGNIIKEEGVYKAVVEKSGRATIKVIAKDKSGDIKEVGTADFLVKDLPLPQVSITGVGGGLVDKDLFLRTNLIELFYPVNMEGLRYEIVSFSIRRYNSFESYSTTGNRLSDRQQQLIEEMQRGERFVIHKIVIKDMHGNEINIEPAEFLLN